MAMALSTKQELFVSSYLGPARGNATEAARIAGYKQPRMHGSRLMTNDDVKARISAYRAQIKAEGIANQQNRIDEQNDRWQLLRAVRAARAADAWLTDVPGGTTGLMVKQLKQVKHSYDKDPDDDDSKAFALTVDWWEAAVDTGYLREIRELEKQTAQELGQIVERKEHSGPGGGPIQITGIDVPLPVRDDAEDDG